MYKSFITASMLVLLTVFMFLVAFAGYESWQVKSAKVTAQSISKHNSYEIVGVKKFLGTEEPNRARDLRSSDGSWIRYFLYWQHPDFKTARNLVYGNTVSFSYVNNGIVNCRILFKQQMCLSKENYLRIKSVEDVRWFGNN